MIASIDLPERVTDVGESVDGMADVAVDILQPTLRGPRQRRWLKRYPHVQQHDQTDCAAACLSMITSFYGHPVGVARLRDLANVDANGATLWSVARAAESLGFHARGLRLEFDDLKHLQLPAVVHWEGMHYIVLYEVRRNAVIVADPGLGQRTLSRAEFLKGWTGLVLELVPEKELTQQKPDTSSLRRFRPIITPYWTMLLEVLMASLILSVLGLGVPLFTQMIVDRVLVHRSIGLLNMLLIGMLILSVFQALMQTVRQGLLVHLSTRCDARMMSDFFRHVFQLPQRFFDLRRVGDITSRVAENAKIRAAMAGTIPGVVLDTVLATTYLALLAYYNIPLTLAVLAILPIFIVMMLIFAPLYRRNQKEHFQKQCEASTFVIESITGISTVKSLAAEPQVRWKLESLFIDAMLVGRRNAHLAMIHSGLATIVHTGSTVFLLWYGSQQVLANAMTTGQLLGFFTIAGNVIGPILGLVAAWQSLQEVHNAIERLNDVFESEAEQSADQHLLRPRRLAGHVRLEEVSYSYTGDDDQLALEEVSLEILPGETVAIVGPSGSGKSTLMKLIQGLYLPNHGRITVDGHDLRTIQHAALRRRIGALPQEVFLFSGTIHDNIALTDPDVPMSRVIDVAKLAGAHEFICNTGLGYETKVGERGQSLSGGQRQRIALARALLHDPDILLLDEPTSALDGRAERTIQRNLSTAYETKTVLIIAHRLSTVRDADRILVMDKGRIIDQGTHNELLKRGGLYAELVGQQLSE